MNYQKKLDAIVLTWLEIKEDHPMFQKRIYKDIERLKQYLAQLFEKKTISNVQIKVCYQLNSVDKAESNLI